MKAADNKAEVIRLNGRKIGFCTGCYACQKLGKCVIKDDANAIVAKTCKADLRFRGSATPHENPH